MGKHAYCIIAHNDRYCLDKLLSLLDDERNDIFILPDKKSDPDLEKGLATKRSNLKIVAPDRRIDVKWGHISLVEAELTVIEEALNEDRYDYIHLISGVDLPLKSQDRIHAFFDGQTSGTLFVAVNETPQDIEDANRKVKYYQFFTGNQKASGSAIKIISAIGNRVLLGLQKVLGIERNWENHTVRKGSNWVSISDEFARYIVSRKKLILKKYRGIKCADEIFIQTELMSSRYKNNLYRDGEGHTDHMRRMEFCGDSPRILVMSDYETLINSQDLFARKFSSTADRQVIDKICENINN